MIDNSALKNEILKDQLGLGYAPLVSTANDQAVAALLNATDGPGAGEITVPTLSRDELLVAILPATLVLPTLSTELQQKWDRVLGIVRAVEAINLTNDGVQGLMAIAVADGVLTAEQALAIGKRTGSRAEVLFGAGTIITEQQVGEARNGE